MGDAILNGLSEQGLRKRHSVKVRANSGATGLDIKDHVRPILRRKPDCVLIHCRTNDLTKKDPIDTAEIIKEIISEAKKLFGLFKGPTCFKASKGRCIDLVLTNKKHSFMKVSHLKRDSVIIIIFYIQY